MSKYTGSTVVLAGIVAQIMKQARSPFRTVTGLLGIVRFKEPPEIVTVVIL